MVRFVLLLSNGLAADLCWIRVLVPENGLSTRAERACEGQLLSEPAAPCMLNPLPACPPASQPKPYPVPFTHIHIRGGWEAPACGPLLDGRHPGFYGHVLCSPRGLGGWNYLFRFI